MHRKPRKKSETGIYHVIVRGIGQQDIFLRRRRFPEILRYTKRLSLESGVSVLGYCLMTNHVHLLLREDYGDISGFMKRLVISYAYWYNWKYERIGHVFQDRFKSEWVEDDGYLLTVIRYIHKNPVKASIISKPEDYKWSSCTAYYKADRNTARFPDISLILRIVHNEKKKTIEGLKKLKKRVTKTTAWILIRLNESGKAKHMKLPRE